MRCLALDVGDERIGVAISDERGTIARPLGIIARKAGPGSFQRIAALVAEHGVMLIVMGMPLLSDGSEGQQAGSVRAYLRGLERHIEVPIVLWDERQSTQQARALLDEAALAGWNPGPRSRGAHKARQRPDDAAAAAVILQEYLNTQAERKAWAAEEDQQGGQNP